jgi:hypothetical protein
MSEEIEGVLFHMAEIAGRMECEASEKRNKKPEIKEEDEIKQAIKEMLVENTGCSILDSGGAYGRGWEKNRHRNFDEEEAVFVEVCNEEVSIQYNIYWYLMNFLSITEDSEMLNKRLQKAMSKSEDSYMEDIENFMDRCAAKGYTSQEIVNTYNYGNILSQILQYAIIVNDDTDEHFIILQIHNGCDARGGYTKPRVFSLDTDDNFTHFCMAQSDVMAFCEKCKMSWYSDDSGYNWYNDWNYGNQEELKTGIESEKDFRITCNEKKNEVSHKNCGGKITYTVMERW